tara:strand:+ start:177 stop:1484 length:1308 start_codon:yes stop_codon:yes gene_type:complete
MALSIKNISFFCIVLFGFILFLSNATKLNINNKNIYIDKNITDLKNKEIKKELSNIQNSNNEILLDKNLSDNYSKKLTEIEVKVQKGQTFSEILDNFKFNNINKFEIINLVNKEFNLRNLAVNQKILFFNDEDNITEKISIKLDFKTFLIIDLSSEMNVIIKELNTYSAIESKEYLITNSLYSDGIKNNIPNEILIKLIKLFSFDLDFQRDIKKETLVSISYEKTNVENQSDYSFGNIEYARIEIKNNTLEYFKFLTNDGFIDYFNRDGKNVKKSILKTPLDGAKLSSNFGMRKHPISGYTKMHKGIDFAAPIGTPIYAGGNGVIEFVGRNGGYGKYIRIRHNNEYKTAYAHLNNYKKGIAKGVRVNQGDIIGYVGNTGLSTGPHLHYEIIYQNKQINPLTLKLPSGKILEGEELKRFKKNYKTILANHLNNLFE